MNDTEFDPWKDFPLCGCGDPGAVVEVFHWLLAGQERDGTQVNWDRWFAFLNALQERHRPWTWMALYVLDHAGLTEHGGSVRGGWLTPKGEAALAFLRAHGNDPDGWPPIRAPKAVSLL